MATITAAGTHEYRSKAVASSGVVADRRNASSTAIRRPLGRSMAAHPEGGPASGARVRAMGRMAGRRARWAGVTTSAAARSTVGKEHMSFV